MKASLNWIRTYADLPQGITAEQLAHDLTMQTVEVEEITNPADLVEGIVIGASSRSARTRKPTASSSATSTSVRSGRAKSSAEGRTSTRINLLL